MHTVMVIDDEADVRDAIRELEPAPVDPWPKVRPDSI